METFSRVSIKWILQNVILFQIIIITWVLLCVLCVRSGYIVEYPSKTNSKHISMLVQENIVWALQFGIKHAKLSYIISHHQYNRLIYNFDTKITFMHGLFINFCRNNCCLEGLKLSSISHVGMCNQVNNLIGHWINHIICIWRFWTFCRPWFMLHHDGKNKFSKNSFTCITPWH